jgi:hypothetical protein
MCLAFFSQIIIVAVPSLLYFSPFLYVCFNFLFSLSLHLGALVPSIHGGGGGLEMYFIFYGGALQGTQRTRKTREKRQPEEKKTQGVYTQTFCVQRREINFTIISHGSVCRFCSLAPAAARAMKLYRRDGEF